MAGQFDRHRVAERAVVGIANQEHMETGEVPPA
jgi:hypothetical protein